MKRRSQSPTVDPDLFLLVARKDPNPLSVVINLMVVSVVVNCMVVLVVKICLCHSVLKSQNRWHRVL